MLFFLIERKEDNIYDFFTIQKDSKVVWFTGCFAWGYGVCNFCYPALRLCGCIVLSGIDCKCIVCSENTFTALIGITDYKIIEVQASTDIFLNVYYV